MYNYNRSLEDIKNDIAKIDYVLENYKNTKKEIWQFTMTKKELRKELFYTKERERKNANI